MHNITIRCSAMRCETSGHFIAAKTLKSLKMEAAMNEARTKRQFF